MRDFIVSSDQMTAKHLFQGSMRFIYTKDLLTNACGSCVIKTQCESGKLTNDERQCAAPWRHDHRNGHWEIDSTTSIRQQGDQSSLIQKRLSLPENKCFAIQRVQSSTSCIGCLSRPCMPNFCHALNDSFGACISEIGETFIFKMEESTCQKEC